ncbi:MAG: guanylate kinase [Clostridia bacterium]|nr:guanylate kinase [Clostridia bacterium]
MSGTTRGMIVVISGPSGSGKGTLINHVMKQDSNVCYAVSATTREMRYGEAEGVNYYYKSDAVFDQLVAENEILEWDSFCGYKYGTLRSELESKISKGQDVILDLTVPGARAIKKAFPEDCITAFILPPSIEELENRIRGRQRENEDQLKLRIEAAKQEVEFFREFDYTVINDDLDTGVDHLWAVIKAERLSYKRNSDVLNRLNLKGAIV